MATRNQKDQQAAEVTQAAEDAPTTVEANVKGAKMAHEDDQLAGGRIDGPILVSEPTREADKTSSPVPNDAKPHDPPVRSTRADVPIAVSMATGAGEHQPPDLADYDADGRAKD